MKVVEYYTWDANRDYTGRVEMQVGTFPTSCHRQEVSIPECPRVVPDPDGWYVVTGDNTNEDLSRLLFREKRGNCGYDRAGRNRGLWSGYTVRATDVKIVGPVL